jgi:Flp pilus assembly protein CpaB
MPSRITAPRNRQRRNSLIPAIVLVVVSIVATAFVMQREVPPAQAEKSIPIVVGEFDIVSLPVPAHHVPVGTKVKDIRFKQVSFPRHQVPAGALLSVRDYLESATVAPLPANLPLFPENLRLLAGAGNPVIERIPVGMRAMTIRVDATSAVEGWAGSGSVVDVLLVEKDRTTVVAEKVRVLSAERSVSPVEGAASPSVPSTVTVLVSQEQCLAINTAIPRGKLAFALRSVGDEDNWSDTIFTAERLRGAGRAIDSRNAVTGYVSITERNSGERKGFSLSNGKWVQSEVIPEGFFASQKR